MTDTEASIEYAYLDVDNEALFHDRKSYLEALSNRKGRAVERCIANMEHNQVLFAGGTKRNAFRESFSEIEAIRMCKRITSK